MTVKQFDSLGRFVLWDYPTRRPFSSFLPGIAGPMGIPLWAFYVNRGQAIASFGVDSKDAPILEFQPANKAYQLTPTTGFRTFIKKHRAGTSEYYEPFSPWSSGHSRRSMHIGFSELELIEEDPKVGLRVSVLYFTLAQEPLAGLVRQLTITNTNNQPMELEIVDGLPQVVPYGADNGALKHVSRTIEAWMGVENHEQRLPHYRLHATAADVASVSAITPAHFALGWLDQQPGGQLLPVIVDPQLIFHHETSLHRPQGLLDASFEDLLKRPQATSGKTPSAFFGSRILLDPAESVRLNSLYGHSTAVENIANQIDNTIRPGWLAEKRKTARTEIEKLISTVETHTSSPEFNAYIQQTYLDNLLRGGWPVFWDSDQNTHVFHIYSRKHGDLERDYNDFHLAPEFYSHGEGNYRDVNQNRRNDVLFDPRVGSKNIRDFLSLIQLDGYNPLVVKGTIFYLDIENHPKILKQVDRPERLKSLIQGGFTPGGLLRGLMDQGVELQTDPRSFLAQVMEFARSEPSAQFGEGFWIDHWTYLLDQVESYLVVFPERKDHLLFNLSVPYFCSAVQVLPRSERYVLTDEGPRQLHALAEDGSSGWVLHPLGEKFESTVFEKLTLLATVKFGTLDPEGMGVEMEAGKPGWYDALNGLPGLFGSSMPETYELIRLIRFLRGELLEHGDGIQLTFPYEFEDYLTGLAKLTREKIEPFHWWERANDLREAYRATIYAGVSGKTFSLSGNRLAEILRDFLGKLNEGVQRANTWASQGLAPTYFRFEATRYRLQKTDRGDSLLDPEGRPYLNALEFQAHPLPLFLEGAVKSLKIAETKEEAEAIHDAVKAGPLFDSKLGMYKINASLEAQPHQIGRARAFTPGWLENESIWLHMEYKYLLELLKADLYSCFFEDLKKVLIPFQPAERYGRSPLENSSFIVSSAHPQEELHGAGFIARLTGATAEFMHIWLLMMAGENPFKVQDGQLVLEFHPALPGWMFDENHMVSFQFLGKTKVTYHNPRHIDTWDQVPHKVEVTALSGERTVFNNSVISAPFAELVRQRKADQIEIYYAE